MRISQFPVDDACFSSSNRLMLAWGSASTTTSTISMKSLSGAVVTECQLEGIARIVHASSNARNVLAVVTVPQQGSPVQLEYVVHNQLVSKHLTNAAVVLPAITKRWNADHVSSVCTQLPRKGTASAAGTVADISLLWSTTDHNLVLHCRQSSETAAAVVSLNSTPVSHVTLGPLPGCLTVADRDGVVSVLQLQWLDETKGTLNVNRLASYSTTGGPSATIKALAHSGKKLIWYATTEGILRCLRLHATSSSSGEFALAPVIFRTNEGAVEEVCEAFSVGHDSNGANSIINQLWLSGEDSGLSMRVASRVGNALQLDLIAVQLTSQAGTTPFCATATSVLLPDFESTVLDFTHSNRSWDVLAKHPRKGTVERVTLDTANRDLLFVASTDNTRRNDDASSSSSSSNKANEVAALARQIAWSDQRELSTLRFQLDAALAQFEAVATEPKSLEEADSAMRHMVALQHGAMACLRRELQETAGELLPEDSVSHSFLRRLQRSYKRLACYRFLYQQGFSLEWMQSAFGVSLDLSNLREQHRRQRQNAQLAFYQGLLLNEAQVDATQRWACWGNPDLSLCVEVLLAQAGLTAHNTMCQVIASFGTDPQPDDMRVTTLQLILLYASCCSQVATDALERNVEVLLRVLHVADIGIWAWARAAFAADHSNAPSSFVTTRLPLALPPQLAPLLLPSIVDGFFTHMAFPVVVSLQPIILSVFPVGSIPHSTGAKLLFAVFRCSPSTVLAELYRHMIASGSHHHQHHPHYLAPLVGRALALRAIHEQSLSHCDGLFVATGEEEPKEAFRAFESVLLSGLEGSGGAAMGNAEDHQATEDIRRMWRSCGTLLAEAYIGRKDFDGASSVMHRLRELLGREGYSTEGCLEQMNALVEPLEARHAWSAQGRERIGQAAHIAEPRFVLPTATTTSNNSNSTVRSFNSVVTLRPEDLNEALSSATLGDPLSRQGSSSTAGGAGGLSSSARPSRRLGAARTGYTGPLVMSSQSPQLQQQQQQTQQQHLIVHAHALVCEAVLPRSKQVCGNPRPCKYHDAPDVVQ